MDICSFFGIPPFQGSELIVVSLARAPRYWEEQVLQYQLGPPPPSLFFLQDRKPYICVYFFLSSNGGRATGAKKRLRLCGYFKAFDERRVAPPPLRFLCPLLLSLHTNILHRELTLIHILLISGEGDIDSNSRLNLSLTLSSI